MLFLYIMFSILLVLWITSIGLLLMDLASGNEDGGLVISALFVLGFGIPSLVIANFLELI